MSRRGPKGSSKAPGTVTSTRSTSIRPKCSPAPAPAFETARSSSPRRFTRWNVCSSSDRTRRFSSRTRSCSCWLKRRTDSTSATRTTSSTSSSNHGEGSRGDVHLAHAIRTSRRTVPVLQSGTWPRSFAPPRAEDSRSRAGLLCGLLRRTAKGGDRNCRQRRGPRPPQDLSSCRGLLARLRFDGRLGHRA